MASRANTQTMIPVRPFRAEDLRQLTSIRESPCLSIHLTTHRRFPEWRQDPIKFKSLLARAEAELSTKGGSRELEGFLEPLRRLLDDESFWEYALDGLVIFLSPSFAAAYRVPIAVPDTVTVADTFHTKPLFRFLRTNSTYYALAVSQNLVTLFQGSVYGAEPVELRSLPVDLVQALGGLGELDEHQKGYTAHGGVAGRLFSGRGPGREDRKENLIKFFRALDKGLHAYLREERAPLLLAAVRYYHPIYREANTYPHLLSEGLDGNYERAKGEDIHAEAWPIVSRDIERRVAEWVDRYRSLEGKGLAVDGAQAVASATVQGRVWTVLASEDGGTAGRLDRATGEVSLTGAPSTAVSADLLDDICEEAWKRGAEIFVLPRTSLPTPNPIAAVLRF